RLVLAVALVLDDDRLVFGGTGRLHAAVGDLQVIVDLLLQQLLGGLGEGPRVALRFGPHLHVIPDGGPFGPEVSMRSRHRLAWSEAGAEPGIVPDYQATYRLMFDGGALGPRHRRQQQGEHRSPYRAPSLQHAVLPVSLASGPPEPAKLAAGRMVA